MKYIKISEMSENVGQDVELKGWLYNARPSGKVIFLIVRDGTGFIRKCTVNCSPCIPVLKLLYGKRVERDNR